MQNLTDDEKLLYTTFKSLPDFTDLTFVRVLLRGTARNFYEAREAFDNDRITKEAFMEADRELRRHAVLYALEAVRNAVEDGSIGEESGWLNALKTLAEMHLNPEEIDPKAVQS